MRIMPKSGRKTLLLVVGLVLLALFLIPFFHAKREARQRQARADNLKIIGYGFALYATQFNGNHPPFDALKSPQYQLLPNRNSGRNLPIVVERPDHYPNEADLAVMYEDGRVEFKDRAEVEGIILKYDVGLRDQ